MSAAASAPAPAPAPSAASTIASARDFDKLTPVEHVLRRPDMYVGSTEPETRRAVPVFNPFTGSMERRDVAVSDALLKVFQEVLANAADNKLRDPRGQTFVRVTLTPTGFTVTNDGATIPCEVHPVHGVYVASMVFGEMMSGSNFDDSKARTTSGRNGAGVKLTNIFSTRFEVETFDVARRKRLRQTWCNNMRETTGPVVTDLTAAELRGARSFTTVRASLDLSRLGLRAGETMSADVVSLMARFAVDLAACFGRDLRVYVRAQSDDAAAAAAAAAASTTEGERAINVNSLLDYAKLYFPELSNAVAAPSPKRSAPTAPAAASATPQTTAPSEEPSRIVHWMSVDRSTEIVLISLTPANKGCNVVTSFVNAIPTPDGGTHVTQVLEALQARTEKLLRKVLGKGSEEAIESYARIPHIRENVALFLRCSVENPAFTSQSKTRLSTRDPLRLPATLWDRVTEEAPFVHALAESIQARSLRAARDATRSAPASSGAGATFRLLLRDLPKLDDASLAGSARSSECALILTEGDSAKTLAIAGLSVVGRSLYGVFPLKGKLLNVRGMTAEEAVKNAEVAAIVRILGLVFGREYTKAADVRTLRYGSLWIMTDQDEDGSHICGLLLNLLETFWPSLLRYAPGFVKRFITPVVRVRRGTAVVRDFFSVTDFEAYAASGAMPRDARVKYYKGLGTSTPAEAREYFSNIGRHLIAFAPMGEEDSVRLRRSFVDGDGAAGARRDWIARHLREPPSAEARRAYDASRPRRVGQFVDLELVDFSVSDNERSIPHVADGLKPSQRKVLYTLLGLTGRRPAGTEFKVAQLAGAVAEGTAYHHGEASLVSTIVGMAQDFVGTNNVPLLESRASMGTRLKGGDDAAQPRYTFVVLAEISKALFPEADTALLEKVREGSESVEPVYFVPVIPTLLLNGGEGIGTGWSSYVPPFNPRDVLRATRALVESGGAAELESTPLVPWWRGFQGSVEVKGGRVHTRGVVERVDARTARIRELPVGRWTDDYKSWLVKQMEGSSGGGGGGGGNDASAAGAASKRARGSASSSSSSATSTSAPAPGPRARASGNSPKRASSSSSSSSASAAAAASTSTTALVESFTENHGVDTVDFTVRTLQDLPTSAEELAALFKLTTTVSLTNMHARGELGSSVLHFESAHEILRVHFRLRRELYVRRLAALRAECSERASFLTERARFILAVVEREIVLERRARAELDAQLREMGFVHGPKHLAMSLMTLTRERLAEVLAERDAEVAELARLNASTELDLWRADLDVLERMLASQA